jgi:murein DD-endopeptidase MepM/ murein hydrolase activator NlpD
MNIILFSKKARKSSSINLGKNKLLLILLFFAVILPGSVMYAGYEMGKSQANKQALPGDWEAEMMRHRDELAETTRAARENMNALAVRLGDLQAHTIRLNALGRRLTEKASLGRGEFNFTKPPAQGGPEGESQSLAEIEVPDFLTSLDELAAQLDDREQQLRVMEAFYMGRELEGEVFPAGRPIEKGWISSYYGMRVDPFTGLQARHKGVDFAGKDGSGVIASAAGVVTWAGTRYGYGNLVEINHGNGYVTRYGHNSKILVQSGVEVEKGQRIALMGSSGRSTGPHVHYEVLKNGRLVDPIKYINAAR